MLFPRTLHCVSLAANLCLCKSLKVEVQPSNVLAHAFEPDLTVAIPLWGIFGFSCKFARAFWYMRDFYLCAQKLMCMHT